ncbi:serine/threonine-protein phosphatase 7 long form [Dorcoceras hygrometricum]|uniref:Serine/threonine-protein phosphatase 7 long form n=1 Tax=Dorcoceras hygrometricum TaxID=472368 RepID=A0A2Z7BUQ0_9LAMI|nr:serine/threonine-protein phosphatase 7 long form [Dorcoceras hygrometricum]
METRTHIFHLPVGETTITLQDVAMIWGLNIDGLPVTNRNTSYSKPELLQRCARLLGFTPEANRNKGAHLHLTALRDHCLQHAITEYNTEEQVTQYSRCVALLIIGGCMFLDSENSAVKLMYLQFLEDIDMVNTYSCGSAVLAYLYRELWSTAMGQKVDICGPVKLLQIWAWSRFTVLCPDKEQQCSTTPEDASDALQGLHIPP